MSLRKKALIILNPVAGKAVAGDFFAIVQRVLDESRIAYELFKTSGVGDAWRKAADSAEDYDVVVGVGGDGTINEIINGLAESKSKVPLAIIPAGTANVMARELGLPKGYRELAGLIINSDVKALDLGEVNGRKFAMCVGVGLDGEIVANISKNRGKKGISFFTYILPTLQAAWRYKYCPLDIKIDGKEIESRGSFLIVANMRNYGGPFSFFSHASAEDGVLNVCILEPRNIFDFVKITVAAMFGKVEKLALANFYTACEVAISAKTQVAVQADGDAAGYLPLRCKVLPGAVNFCVPKK